MIKNDKDLIVNDFYNITEKRLTNIEERYFSVVQLLKEDKITPASFYFDLKRFLIKKNMQLSFLIFEEYECIKQQQIHFMIEDFFDEENDKK